MTSYPAPDDKQRVWFWFLECCDGYSSVFGKDRRVKIDQTKIIGWTSEVFSCRQYKNSLAEELSFFTSKLKLKMTENDDLKLVF